MSQAIHIQPHDLPVRTRAQPFRGTRLFTDEEEDLIFQFVKRQGNPPEIAAFHCRVTKVTVDNICRRVAQRCAPQTKNPGV